MTEEERALLDLAVEGAGRFYHAQPQHFQRAVEQRLELGKERYRGAYRTRDCLAEAREEPIDVPAWLMLDMRKAREAGVSEDDLRELSQAALPAMAASAAAWAALDEYAAKRDAFLD